MRSLKRRIAALERCYGVGTDGGCVACRHWSPTISFSVPWSNDPSPATPPPGRCGSCGRPRRRIIVCFDTSPEAPGRQEEQSGRRMTEVLTGPAEAPTGPEGTAPPGDDPIPALATTAPPTDTAVENRSAHTDALPRDATAEGSLAPPRSPIGGPPGSEPLAGETGTTRGEPWPIYVAARAIEIGCLSLQAGEAFPIQDKHQIRSYGAALGVPDADRRPFHELPYVAVRYPPHRW